MLLGLWSETKRKLHKGIVRASAVALIALPNRRLQFRCRQTPKIRTAPPVSINTEDKERNVYVILLPRPRLLLRGRRADLPS